uniref:DNA topoisomerase 2 n=1 Tax=Pithovirus LCPAC201 TaxID=2506591 RepID=A0A481Z8C0_9VIRU|nr:MAG: DNA topoisomerase II [Pithovirus LCPAC201]
MQLSIQPETNSPTIQLNLGGQNTVLHNGENVRLNLQTSASQFNLTEGTQRLAYNADRYEKLDHRTHVYQVSDTYIGSDEQIPRCTTLLDMTDIKNPKIIGALITLPEGPERLCLEVLTNAGDNVIKSRLAGVNPGEIKVTMDRKTIVVRNGGRVIPIEIHPTLGVYVPEMLLGMLLTSDNYKKNKKRTGAGRNGYGAKITNVYSHYFKVEIGDPQAKLYYTQEWRNNMKDRFEPVITQGYNGESFVQITYQMDQERFKYQEYPDEAFGLFARHAADMAFNHRVTIHFNQVELKFKDIKDFARCRFGGDHKTLIHYEWAPGTPVTTKRSGLIVATDPKALPVLEIILVDTPSEGKIISFTNAMINSDGGVHVDAVIKAIQGPILSKINGAMSKSRRGKNGKVGPTLTATDLKRHISIIISYRAINAKFRGQTKEKLISPKPSVKIAPERFSCLGRWNLVDRLIRALEAKQEKLLSKTDGRRKRHIDVPQSEDANWAGRGKRSKECWLVLTEGLSATTYAMKLFAHKSPKYKDTYGFLPLRGKFLNPIGAPKMQIATNKEITALKKLLGLKEGLDYRKPQERASLRYGGIIIIADPDVDGKHILGLIINYLNYRFPSLLINEMVHYIKVPIIRVKFRGASNKFYNLAEYQRWQERTPNSNSWKARYFKGLGTSRDSEITEDYDSIYSVQIIYDQHANEYLNLAFNPKNASSRKGLIERYVPDQTEGRFEKEAISHIVNYEVMEFSVADVERSIPGFDGFKDSQRRIIHAVLAKWGKKIGQKNLEPMKVARLGPYVATKTHYHHGEKSLNDAIVNMAQRFVGTNNLSPLVPDGDFGTRRKNGKDASAPRYINTTPAWWLRLLLRDADDGILKIAMEEGKERGYDRFKPIIPIALVNGCKGIATGFSTFIPPHNPMDLCIWLILYMSKLALLTLIPWYRGFTGNVKIARSRGGKRVTSRNEGQITLVLDPDGHIISSESDDIFNQEETEEAVEGMGEDDLEFDLGTRRSSVTERKSVYTQGVLIPGINTVVVTELPIGRSIHGYDVWLRTLLAEGKITDFESHSQPNMPYFTITGMKSPSIRNLRLERSFGLSNMVLLDDNGRPRYYETAEDLMKTFYHYRLNGYRARKDLLIRTKQEELIRLSNRIRFIQAVVDGTLIIMRRTKDEIYIDMDNLQLPRELLKSVSLYQCTADNVEILKKQITKTKAELEMIKKQEPVKMWQIELLVFVEAYLKHYPDEINRFTHQGLQNTIFSQYYYSNLSQNNVKGKCEQEPAVCLVVPPHLIVS